MSDSSEEEEDANLFKKTEFLGEGDEEKKPSLTQSSKIKSIEVH
jgi:hypothetical protein